jgi:hypothetical protein
VIVQVDEDEEQVAKDLVLKRSNVVAAFSDQIA